MNEAIAAQLLWVVGSIFGVAVLLLVVGSLVRREVPRARMGLRYATEVGILLAILVPAYFGRWPVLGLAALLFVGCARELYGVLRKAGHAPLRTPAIVAGLGVVAAAGLGPPSLELPALVFLGVSALLVAAALLRPASSNPSASAGATVLGLTYLALPLACFVLVGRRPDGFGHVAYLLGLVELSDSFAMIVGTYFGRRRVFGALSPGKTLEGSLAGLAAALSGAFLLAFTVPGLSLGARLGAALLVGLATQAGDLVASALKREAGVKDFSTLIPSQGGLLDVYDALVFSAPLYYVFLSCVRIFDGGAA